MKATEATSIVGTVIRNEMKENGGIWLSDTKTGYWSFKSEDLTRGALDDLQKLGALETVRKHMPEREALIFSARRAAGIGLLDVHPTDTVVDIGCMWGSLTVPIARMGCRVIGIDQTRESLLFLQKRLEEEHLNNVDLVNANTKEIEFAENSVDKIVVNGVLEWLPQEEKVAVTHFYRKRETTEVARKVSKAAKRAAEPKRIQQAALSKFYNGLKPGGLLYLAIENRYYLDFFFGRRDPHTGLRFVDVLPRALQTPYSLLCSGRPFRTWIYSERELTALLWSAGFNKVHVYYSFPDYHFPELILSKRGLQFFHSIRAQTSKHTWKKLIWKIAESTLFRRLKLGFLAPAFIMVAEK